VLGPSPLVDVRARAGAVAVFAFVAVGLLGAYRYVDNYWYYRGFAPPKDPAYVHVTGVASRFFAGRISPL